jgi:serine protease Do
MISITLKVCPFQRRLQMPVILLSIAVIMTNLNLLLTPSSNQLYHKAAKVALSNTVQIRVYLYEHGGVGGSGVILNNGKVVTAYHVVSDEGRAIIAVKADGTKVGCRVVKTDSTRDIALLQCDGFNRQSGVRVLHRDTIAVGLPITIAGAPARLPIILTQGIVCGEYKNEGKLILDATSGPGGSGGPVFTLQGELVGLLQAGSPMPPFVVFTTSNLQLRRFLNEAGIK